MSDTVMGWTGTQWQVATSVIQAVGTLVLVGLTWWYVRLTKIIAQAGHVVDVRLIEVVYDVRGNEGEDEGWFMTLRNNTDERALVIIERRVRGRSKKSLQKRVLERTSQIVVPGLEERTILMGYEASFDQEDIRVEAQSITGFKTVTWWRVSKLQGERGLPVYEISPRPQ